MNEPEVMYSFFTRGGYTFYSLLISRLQGILRAHSKTKQTKMIKYQRSRLFIA